MPDLVTCRREEEIGKGEEQKPFRGSWWLVHAFPLPGRRTEIVFWGKLR